MNIFIFHPIDLATRDDDLIIKSYKLFLSKRYFVNTSKMNINEQNRQSIFLFFHSTASSNSFILTRLQLTNYIYLVIQITDETTICDGCTRCNLSQSVRKFATRIRKRLAAMNRGHAHRYSLRYLPKLFGYFCATNSLIKSRKIEKWNVLHSAYVQSDTLCERG